MAKTLQEFTSELRNRNIARPNQYYVDITPPPGMLGTEIANSSRLAGMWCHTATTPQSSIYTNDQHIEFGSVRKYAHGHEHQNLVLDFYIDQDFEIREFFDRWRDLIVPHKRYFQFSETYTSDKITVYILNQEDRTTYKYEYRDIWPKTIQSVNLSYANGNSVATFSVEFVFREVHWTNYRGVNNSHASEPKLDTAAFDFSNLNT